MGKRERGKGEVTQRLDMNNVNKKRKREGGEWRRVHAESETSRLGCEE